MPKQMQNQTGFTLIELLVVAALSVIIIVGASSLFYTALISNSRKDTLTAVKQEGDFAVGQMEFLLRNAVSLEHNPTAPTLPICDKGMNTITFRERDEGITTLGLVKVDNNYQIASSSGTTTLKTSFLTSTAVSPLDPNSQNPTPLFDCEQTNNAGAYILIHFTLYKQSEGLGSTSTTDSQAFSTSVNLRSF
jgi:prepilin-type N-terminal cleavage/methylation domain-containing protein